MERAELDQIERVINHELRERFLPGAVERAVLLQHGDDPAIQPGQLLVRVFVPPPDRPEDYEQALAAWQAAHQAGMDRLRRELSLRLPAARLLEFTFDDPGTATPRIAMPDDGSLAAEQMSGREIVTTALSLLRANYVFPELAEQAAIAIEARLTAGEYDHLDEITLTELVTRHLQEVCEDKHLGLRLGGGPRPGAPGARRARSPRGPARTSPEPGAPRARTREPGTTRPGGWPCGRRGGWTTSASAGSSGWTATSATWTCAGWPCRPTRDRPSRRRWNWWPGPTRSSSTCGTTTAARRRAWSSGAATCSMSGQLTSTTSSTPTPARPGSSGRCPTCRAPATSTGRSTC